MPALYQLAEHEIVRVHDLPQGTVRVGRDLSNEIVLHELSVSRFHCRIIVNASEAWIEDLESQNGTFVSGRRISSPRRLISGAQFRLGSSSLIYWDECQTDPTVELQTTPVTAVVQKGNEEYRIRVWWWFDWNYFCLGWRIRRR